MAGNKLGIPPRDRAEEGILWYVQSRGLKGGDRLPAERELAMKLGVSRTALRSAIAQLISTHVLQSIHGSGTYVRPPKPLNIIQQTFNFSDAVRTAGLRPGSRLIYQRVTAACAGLADKIDLPPESPVFEMRRVRLADGRPVSLETAFVNLSLCPGIESHDFSRESLYEILDQDYAIRVEHGVEQISITRANAEEAELLQVNQDHPLFFERALERDGSMVPVEYLKAVIIPSRYRFASSSEGDCLARIQKADAAWLRS